ncbi:Archaeal Lon protease [Candidatus Bilamarchaeum dharawalense]|uniref:Archaeal Lon protease n=1 Tax=Candidatus Bilamarchaeum dharawalense TaxID=2885759 RepID=A0A5E4LSG5_9ARCH|nr:Archaeal Lon protease [Candidatus Bilamarchaeum dharawalense]
MRIFLYLFSILYLLSLVQATCSGDVSYYIPAVVGDGGGLVKVEMTLAPGPGDVYVTIDPRIGLSTQESIENAVAYGHEISSSNEQCDVYVNFPNKAGTNLIDGPSGGASFGLMAYSLFNNEEMRRDTIITGTIDRDGNVGPVGGLYEKAKGASTVGAKYFITPEETLYETFLLKNAEDKLNLTVLQVDSMDELVGFMFHDKPIEKTPLASKKRPIPELPYNDYSGINRFKSVATRMIDLERTTIQNMPDSNNDSTVVNDFFENELQRQTSILDHGYLFTAANEAFLNYIDMSTIDAVMKGEFDLPKEKGDAGKCLTGITRPKLTDKNFEWIIGSDLRQAWAYDKLNNTKIDDLLVEEEYTAYNEIMYAEAWCEVAKGLIEFGEPDGTELDESAWQEIAQRKINEAKATETTDEDLLSRLIIAEKSYKDGRYGAAIYDSVFVIANAQEPPEEPDMSILNETRTSLWGQVYQSHAKFLYLQNMTATAYSTATYAKQLDLATAEMKEKIKSVAPEDVKQPELNQCGLPVVMGLLFLFIVVVIITERRSYGTNGP